MAEWKPFDLKWGRSIWYCSACEESTEVPTYLGTPMYNFCPMCGANMNMKSENKQADTPQTDKDKVVCPNCGRSDYIRSFEKDFNIKNSEYRYKCINCNTYIKDTLQSKISSCKECKVYAECPDADSDVSSLCGMQIDCGWGEPNE